MSIYIGTSCISILEHLVYLALLSNTAILFVSECKLDLPIKEEISSVGE